MDTPHGKYRLKGLITKHAASFKGGVAQVALRAMVVSRDEQAFERCVAPC